MSESSRSIADLHPVLVEAWEYLRQDYGRKWPNSPKVALSQTYRNRDDQERAFVSGGSKFRYGQSLHNVKPAFAFDIYFDVGRGVADWSMLHFERFAVEAKRIGLEWGGDWQGLVDGPHFQFRGATVEHARQGIVPAPPVIPRDTDKPGAGPWVLVLMKDGEQLQLVEIPEGHAIFDRMSPERRRYYIDVRSERA